jgi:ATP-dependent DNA helicase DinG
MFAEIFGKDGLLAQKLKGYEYRSQQLIMADKIGEAIRYQKHLLVEAGTGTGKSLAYLIPFIYWTVNEDKRVVISTYTKTLQQQIVMNDLPLLTDILGINFRFALCVGGENYLCLRRFYQVYGDMKGIFVTLQEVEEFYRIDEWRKNTQTGLKQELDFEPLTGVWQKICRESDMCMYYKCEYAKECYYLKVRKMQQQAQILVANHHLFFANVAAGNMILPMFDAVVFDEAHNLEDVATMYFGLTISNTGIKYLLDGLYNPETQKGLLSRIRIKFKDKINNIVTQIAEIKNSADRFFMNILELFGNETQEIRLRSNDIIHNIIHEPILKLADMLQELKTLVKDDVEQIEIEAFITRCRNIGDTLECIVTQMLDGYVYWIEIVRKERYTKIVLHADPIDIAQHFKDNVLSQIAPVIFTSATLSTNNSFNYIRTRLGIDTAEELILDSPFDYTTQVVIYIPKDIPSPKEEDEYIEHCTDKIEKILSIMDGRSFVLFTSYAMLDRVFKVISNRLPEFNHIKQGDMSPGKAVEMFKMVDKPVLWGTATFWQGIDVPGDMLQCVIITKLPFAVPDDPVIESRIEYLRDKHCNPFWEYQVPQAIILTKQGFGRLIRRKDDSGVVCILDNRIYTKSYGKLFVEALPECRYVSELDEVKEFVCSIRNKQLKRKR